MLTCNSINSVDIFHSLNARYLLTEKNIFSILDFCEKEDFTFFTKEFKSLPVEIRAIIPNNVFSFIEYTKDKFIIYYNHETLAHNHTDNFATVECLWYSLFFYLMYYEDKAIFDLILPHHKNQPKSMIPFKSLIADINLSNVSFSNILLDLEPSLSPYQILGLKLFFLLLSNRDNSIISN